LSQPKFHALEDLRFDTSQNGWWSLDTGLFYADPRSVNAMVPKQWWPKISARDAKTGNLKETIIKPADYTADVGTGLVVEGSIWWPGMPSIVENFVVSEKGALIPRAGSRLFNSYRPPPSIPSLADEPATRRPSSKKAKKKKAQPVAQLEEEQQPDNPWIAHIKALWPNPDEYNFFFDYCAHMLQRPEEKCNSIVCLSGEQGIGKDLALLPVKLAIGEWNVEEIGPDDLIARYNPWVQSVMVVVNEMRPAQEEFHASSMYEQMKKISVTPPEMLSLSEKYMRMRYVKNVMRLFLTTNNITAMYINANDRRFAILHSSLKTDWQPASYFTALADWLNNAGGNIEIARWLFARDLSQFEPKRRPLKTAGWQAVVDTWSAPDDALAKALDILKAPDAFFVYEAANIFDLKDELATLTRFPRKLSHRAQQSGYYVLNLQPPMRFVGKQTLVLKSAFVRSNLINDPDIYKEQLMLRGQLLADGIPIIGQRAEVA
jgi:hypothetical protein